MKKIATAYIAIVLCMMFTVLSVSASSLSNTLPNTNVSGWSYFTPGHMGTKVATYGYDSDYTESLYDTYVVGGIGLWGTNISMSKTTNTKAKILFNVNDQASEATASTQVMSTNVDSDGHRQFVSITIYSQKFNNKVAAGKIRTIAHELGHAYGLGHVSTSSNIMYDTYSTTKNVTSKDIWGMKVVTHVHTHNASTMTGHYYLFDDTYHTVLCSSCKALVMQAHTFNNGVCTKCGYQLY